MAKLPPNHPDAVFANLGPLKAAEIQLTFDQEKRTLAHRIGAIHTNAEGKTTAFTVDIVDAERRKAFMEGAGDHIQKLYEERCNAAFAQRTNPKATAEQTQTPDAAQPALKIAALGAWDTSIPKKPIFVLAQWAWKDAEGVVHNDGRPPASAKTQTAKRTQNER